VAERAGQLPGAQKNARLFNVENGRVGIKLGRERVRALDLLVYVESQRLVFMPSAALEFSRFLPRPTLYNYFRFGIELYCVASLPMQNTEKTIFPSTEWEVRHGRGDANVDADISRRRLVTEFSCGGATGGKK
jgi:hypothetical protein